ncbi:MAG: prolyl oligopeptidase family serine peptidase [Acidimicrobiales bacterium]
MPVAPFGSWPSSITADSLVADTVSLSDLVVSGGAVWWVEGRPAEAGRQVVVRAGPGTQPVDVLPMPWSARTRVHEYGGAPYAVHGETFFFANFEDQRLHRLEPGGAPVALTAPPPSPGATRFADISVHPDGQRLACVRERHLADGQVLNDIVEMATDGSRPPEPVAGGRDFYSSPRYSPTGDRLAWLCWDHPRMPWDGTELWLSGLHSAPERVAGSETESVTQPRWASDGALWWISDSSGWWNLVREGRTVAPMEAELSGPDWVFGQSTYVFLDDGRVAAAASRGGFARLVVVDPVTGQVDEVPTGFTAFASLRSLGGRLAAVAASSRQASAVVAIDLRTGRSEVLRTSRSGGLAAGSLSEPRAVEFTTTGGEKAHALFYPPANAGWQGPAGELPPLVVMSHGGPTSAATPALNPLIQLFTSRGLAVVDVNYRGSTGYGRAYRSRLDGEWGVVDVDDCVAAARHLASVGEVDGRRMAIRGSSAGGLTTLGALVASDDFAAGAIHYGVTDLEALATDTHKFEARYLDRLVGPWPEARDLYRQRSPIHSADRLSVPLILFQGTEDKVVPPSQADVLAGALRSRGLPFAYSSFEGEGHGFRRAETIKRAAEAELWFYGQVLGFEPADDIEPVPIENR